MYNICKKKKKKRIVKSTIDFILQHKFRNLKF